MSYGIYLVLVMMCLYGDGLECVVLMGVEGLDDMLKLLLVVDVLFGELVMVVRLAGVEDL